MERSRRTVKFLATLILVALTISFVPVTALADSYSAVVTASSVKVYWDAGRSSYAGTLSRGAIVKVNADNGSVAQITLNSKTGYCDLSDLTAVDDIARPAYINASGVKVYLQPNTSSTSRSVNKGMEVNVVAVSGSWALVEKDGVGAYMYAGYLTYTDVEATPSPATPTPAPESPTPAPAETPIVDEIPAVVTSESLPVYKSASTSSAKLGTLRYGADVTVMAYNGTWAYIQKDGNFGYCKISGLTRADALPTAQPTDMPTKAPSATVNPKDYIPAVVTADSVVVYESANTSSKKLGTLKKGAEINVVQTNGAWAYIEKSGYFGFCALSALTKKSELPTEAEKYRKKYPDVQFTATVIYDGAPVYAEPTDKSSSGALALAQQVDIYAYNDNWAYLGVGDARGFVQIKYLNAAKYTTLSSGDSSADVTKLQKALEAMGYFDGVPGGNFSTLTATAVKRFQAAVGLSQTGTADIATLRVLYGGYAPQSSMITTDLGSGAKGASVERLQTRLFSLGYFSKVSSIDGDYGSMTITAVKLFQEAAGLSTSGTANAATLRALYKNGAPALPASKKAADHTNTSSGGGSSNGVTKMPSGLASTQTSIGSGASNAEKIEHVIYHAQLQLGKPYIYGTAGPNSFDCSGLTTYAFKKVNVSLGRSAYAHGYQSNSGVKIESISDLKRGDIVCFNTIEDSDLSDHVGIYLGQGYFIHSSSGTGNGKQVCISSLSSGYYNRVFSWARRPLP